MLTGFCRNLELLNKIKMVNTLPGNPQAAVIMYKSLKLICGSGKLTALS